MGSGDLDALSRVLAQTATWSVGGNFAFSGVHEGLGNIVSGLLLPVGALFKPGHFKVKVRRLLAQDDYATVEYISYNVSITGQLYEAPHVLCLEMQDEMVQNVREYYDTQYFSQFLGDRDSADGL